MPDPLPILVTFARPEESRAFLNRIKPVKIPPLRGFPAYRGSVEKVPVWVWHTGIGHQAASEVMTANLAQLRSMLVLGCGFAGALDPQLEIGDVVVDDRGDRTGGPTRLVSTEAPVETVEAKAALFQETGAQAVDMETEATAVACARAGIPMTAIRAISDRAGDPLPVPFDRWYDLARQRPRPLRLLAWLATHPSRIRPFARFVRQLRGVGEALAFTIEGVIRSAGNH